ncbi:endonuclease/exonuclease/phosphatase family protein [Jiella sp. M17.18]|uniref:endonuclease/exonuclease/phosphatase family protein n=1 Tax=Jiella sp. M17.18 TaxID=3234247 RepID=UPI0034DE29F1
MPPTAASLPEQDHLHDPIRIVTWNCHGSVGSDRRCRPERIVEHVRRLDPDVLALQEVDGRAHFGRRPGAFRFFAEAFGGHVVEARTTGEGDRAYGHLLWSRVPLVGGEVHRLPGPGLEPRAAIAARLATPAGPLGLIAAHFGLSPRGRRRQAGFIAARVTAAEADMPMLILGDFNEWARGPVHRTLAAVLPEHAAPRSWPSRWPLARMDRIYLRGEGASLTVCVDRQADGASDHLPVVVELRLPKAPAA